MSEKILQDKSSSINTKEVEDILNGNESEDVLSEHMDIYNKVKIPKLKPGTTSLKSGGNQLSKE